jgi:hypothetical protein
MTSLELDLSVLPKPLPGGSFEPPEKVFSVTKLEDTELEQLIRVGQSLVRQTPGNANNAKWDIQTNELLRVLPWLRPWSQSVDEFLRENGGSLTPPIHRDEGFSVKLFLSRQSEDHMDIPRFWPTALSIGLIGTRELVGIVQPSPEATIELATKLIMDKTPLRTLEEIDGVPVERHIQQPGEVVTIGSFATLHSGFPLDEGVAMAIANRNRQVGGDPKYIVDHYMRFYPEVMS